MMNLRLLPIIWILVTALASNVSADETPRVFRRAVLWDNNVGKGVLLISPTEMLIVDSKGQKYGKVITGESVNRAYVSPDGKKLAYTTASGIWLAKLETGENARIAGGYCSFFQWNPDSTGFLFLVDEHKKDTLPPVSDAKLFWADGAGKNLKQVYP